MKNKTRGLFDEQFRLDKIGKQNYPGHRSRCKDNLEF